MWINTKVEFEWNGEKYVEVHSEGYEYEGDVALAVLEKEYGSGYEGETLSPPPAPPITSPTGGPWSGDSVFFEWFMGTYPNMDWDSLSEQQQNAYWTSYQQVTAETGGDDGTGDDGTGDTTNWWDKYAADSGFLEWLEETQGYKDRFGRGDFDFGSEDETVWNQYWNDYQASLVGDGDDGTDDEEVDPNDPTQVGDKWMDSAGNLWASYEEAYASNVRIRQAEEERAGRVADFETRFAEYEKLIEEGSTEEKALAQRMSARMRGQLERRIRDSILATGGEVPEGFTERLAETSTRQLLDITSNIEQRRIAQLTGAKQFEIGTGMSLEQIGVQETGLEQQMFQFLSTQAQREAQFEGTMGMQTAELALRKQLGLGQLDLGQSELGLRRELGMAEIAGMPEQMPWWQQMLVGFGQGVGTGAGMLLGSGKVSDRRLKQNIVPVGQSPSGINIYQFNYLWDSHNTYQGVMAQEVPYASVMSDAGYYLVDYSKVDVEFRSI